MKNKRNLLIGLATILIVVVGIVIYFLVPQKILHTDEQVAKITLFDGNSGNSATVTDPEEIAYIVAMFNDKKFKVRGISAFTVGFSMRIKYFDENEKEILEFITSGEYFRYRGLHYKIQDGSIDYTYLENRVKRKR